MMIARRKLPYGWIIAAALAAALFCLVYPVYVIRPFRAQGPRELQAALAVLRVRPIVLGIAMAAALASAVFYWPVAARRWRAVLAIAGALIVAGVAALARINIYEKMFHPMGPPAFDAASATKLDGAEKVITVAIGGEARAYPIRSMSYHHVVNDAVGGVPIVATY
jgi:hypothetical protein